MDCDLELPPFAFNHFSVHCNLLLMRSPNSFTGKPGWRVLDNGCSKNARNGFMDWFHQIPCLVVECRLDATGTRVGTLGHIRLVAGSFGRVISCGPIGPRPLSVDGPFHHQGDPATGLAIPLGAALPRRDFQWNLALCAIV
jgi:hypothetical protein